MFVFVYVPLLSLSLSLNLCCWSHENIFLYTVQFLHELVPHLFLFVLSLFFLCFIVSFSLILSGLIEQNGDLTTGTRNTYIAGAGDMIFILFNSLVVIVMLNLLIAILGNTYSRIASHEKVQMQFERARCIYEIERHFMPDFAKRFNKFFPRTKCFFFFLSFLFFFCLRHKHRYCSLHRC